MPASKLELINHIGGSISDLCIEGRYAYIGMGAAVAIFDISDLRSINRISYITLPYLTYSLYLAGNYLYVVDERAEDAAESANVHIVSIANPYAPELVSSYPI